MAAREQVLLHPSQLGNIKKSIPLELRKKLKKFDQVNQGVLTKFTSKFRVLHGGRGRIVDTSSYVQYTVKYSCTFAKPTVGAKVIGRVQSLVPQASGVVMITEVEGCELVCIVRDIDPARYQV